MRKLVLCLALLAPLPALAQTAEEERDRSFLSDLIEGQLTSDDQVVRIDGFRGALSSEATVARLSIADANGEWLVARDLRLDWTRSALFQGRLEVERLSAGSIEIIRAPQGDAPPPSPEAVPFALPDLPVSVSVGLIAADSITLGAALIGQEVTLSLDGTAQLSGGEGTARITAERIDGTAGRFAFTGGFSNTSRVLDINLDLSEGPGGIAATLLGLPGDPALDLTVQGTAPIDDYDSTLRLASDGQERVTGRFRLGTQTDDAGGTERAFMLDLTGDVTPLMAPEYRDFFGPDVTLALTGQTEADGTFDMSALTVDAQAVRLQGAARIGPDGWPERFTLTGDLGLPDGAPVILPLSGDPVTVRAMDLSVGYDAAQGDAFTARFVMESLVGSGFAVPSLTLDGGGSIVPARGTMPGSFAVDLAYAASGLQLDDAGLARAVGPEVTGTIRASRADDGPVVIDGLTVTGPGLDATLAGAVGAATEGLPYDLTLQLDAGDLTRFDLLTGLDLAGAADVAIRATGEALNRSFSVTVDGATTDLSLGIAQADAVLGGAGQIGLTVARDATGLRVERADVTTQALTLTGAATLTSGDSEGSFALVLDDVGRALDGLSGPAEVTGRFTNGAEAGLVVDASARLPGALADFTAARPALSEVTTLDLSAAIPALSAFAEAAGMPLTGSADLTATGTLGPAGTDLTVNATTADLAIGITAADALLAGAGRIDARILRDTAGAITVDGLRIITDLVDASADVRLVGGGAEGTFDATIAETAGLATGLSGPATAEGSFGRTANGDTLVDVTAGALGATADVAGTLTANGLFTGRASVAAGDLGTLAAFTGRPLGGSIRLSVEGQLATDLATLDLTLAGETGALDAGIPDLAPLLAGQGLFDGRIARTDGVFDIQGLSFATPGLRVRLDGQTDGAMADVAYTLTLPQIALVAPGLDGTGSVQGSLTRTTAGALTLDLTGSAPGTTLTVAARSEGDDPLAGLTGDLSVSARDLAPFSRLAGMALSGAVDLGVTGRVVPADGSFDLRVDATTRNLNPGNATVARLLAGTGTVSAALARNAEAVLLARDLDVAFPNLTVTGSAEGAGSNATATFNARLADLGLFAPDFPGPATAQGSAQLSNGTWTVDAALTGPGGTSADVAGSVAPGGALNLSASGALPLGLANAFVEPRRIDGQATFDLRLTGAAAVENITGTIRTEGAGISDPTLGTGLTGFGGSVTLGGGRATLDLSGAIDGGGTLAVAGSVGLGAPFAADLTVTATDAALRDPELYETTASGTIRLAGPLTGGAAITGAITLGPAEVRIPSSGIGSLGDLPAVVHQAPPRAVVQTLDRAGLGTNGQTSAGGGAARPFSLDILISAPSQIFIRGRGLDAELGGSLRIGGTTAQVVPSGALELIRGRLDILQQRFILTEGRADLQGDFIPWLRLVAETEARTGTMVAIIVEGPATAPTVTFGSSPELPQDEVLSQLLFGRDLASITPLQAVQLAAAVGTLAGTGGGGIIDNLRMGLGVDDLDVVTTEDGSAALRVGTYLTENIYTDVTVGAETEVNINLDLTEDITVTGSVAATGDTSLGIYFERDY